MISYCGILYNHINSIVNTEIDQKKKEAEYEKLFSYLDENIELGSVNATYNDSIIFKDVSFKYDDKIVLDHFNASFKMNK